MKPLTREEEDIEVMRSWMEVGGLPACPKEEAKGYLQRQVCSLVFHPAFLSPFLTCYSYFIVIGYLSFFSGVKITT